MICTIGSLVQETSHRRRWVLAGGLYTAACAATSLLLGGILGGVGALLRQHVCLTCMASTPAPSPSWAALVLGVLSIAYAVSDLGLLRLPRPRVMYAVPLTWWRRWQPYGAAVAYGAALGIGVTTQVPFGAFYILCLWVLVNGNAGYGAFLLATYGMSRALVLFPVSWSVYCTGEDSNKRMRFLYGNLSNARLAVALPLALFGAMLIVAGLR